MALTIATRAGVHAHGRPDPANVMLAREMGSVACAAAGGDGEPASSVHFHVGNGLVPAVALLSGFQPVACDRALPNALATARTLALNAGAAKRQQAGLGVVHHVAVAGELVPDGSAAIATIRIPTDRIGIQMAVAEAFRVLSVGGSCLLAGANDEGARPAARLVEKVFGNVITVALHSRHRLVRAVKHHDRPLDNSIFRLPWLDPDEFRQIPMETDIPGEDTVTLIQFTRPGVFSWEHLDEATKLLTEVMIIRPGERVLDLGCGAGGLGMVAGRRSGARTLLLDADADAVRCASRTARTADLGQVEVRASDIGESAGDEQFDVVVTNPPFHAGKVTDLDLPQAFIDDSWRALVPGGRLYLVANRTLPYERLIHRRFGDVRTVHDGRRFKVLGAVRA